MEEDRRSTDRTGMKHLLSLLLTVSVCLSAHAQVTDNSIPFIHRGHIYVPATLNGTLSCHVLYDTGGSQLLCIDSVYLAHSDWHPQNLVKASMGGGAGRTQVRVITDGADIQIGSLNDHYNIVPIMKLRDIVNCHADGLWGIKNVNDYPFEINFQHHYLRQHKQGKPNVADYIQLPIRYEDHRILVQATLRICDKTLTGWYLMDTGGSSSVTLTAKTAADYQLNQLPIPHQQVDYTQYGVGDKQQECVVEIKADALTLGNDTMHDLTVEYIPNGEGAFGDRPYLGAIGNQVWSEFNLIIDTQQNILYLHRFAPEDPASRQSLYDYGFRNRTDIGQGWKVSQLHRDGHAAQAGLHLGDIITAVNGRPVTDYTWEEEYDLFTLPYHELDFTDSSGQPHHIRLEAKEREK